MPADVEAIAKAIKEQDPQGKHVRNPYAVAWSIHNKRVQAHAALKAHRRKRQEEGSNG